MFKLTKPWKFKGKDHWSYGKKLTPEHRAKLSAAGKNRKHSEETKKKMSDIAKARNKDFYKRISRALMGRKFSEEHRAKISTAKKGRQCLSENNNWRGGVSFIPYPLGWSKTFKEQIRYRDGYRCQLCGMPETENGKRLDVHHIDYNKTNLSEKNLISLCVRCHRKTNHNRQYWAEYFESAKNK